MKSAFCLAILLSSPAFAATYYVDAASGSDTRTAAQAQSEATPWKSISKAAATATAGDTVVIAGGFYHEQVAPKNAGTAAKPVVYRAKDRSDRPVVDGSILLDTNAWSNVTLVNYRGQSVSVKTCEIGWTPTALFCGGERLRVAHEPEQVNGDDPYELERMSVISSANPGTSTTTLIDTSFFTQSDAKYWVGAELMIYYRGTYGNGNVIEVREITSYSPSAHSVTVSTPFNQGTFSAVCVYPGDRWALRNHIKLLDSPGEYYVDTSVTPNRLYVIPPAGHAATELSATKFDYGFEVSNRAYQTIDSLEFRGQTEAAVFSQYGNAYGKGLVVTNCYIHNELKNGVRVNVTTDAVVSDTVVKLCTNEGISFGSGANFSVVGCTVCSNGNNGVWFGSGPNNKYFAASNILVRGCHVFHQSGRRSHADNFQMQQCDNVEISSCLLEQEGEQNGWCQFTGHLVFTNNTVIGGPFGFGAVMYADISRNFFDRSALRFDAHLDDAPISEKTHYLPLDVGISNNIVRASAIWWPKKYVTLADSFSTAANDYVPPAKSDDWSDMSTWNGTKGVGYGANSIVETDPAVDVSAAAVAARFAAKGVSVGPDFRPEEATSAEPSGLNGLDAPDGDRFTLPLTQTWPDADYGAEVCLWRYDRYAALSFGHDDNCSWDIPFLLREAERNGIRLTWWLITVNVDDVKDVSGGGTWDMWRTAFAAGHALESHSHTHEWAGGGRTVPAAAEATGMSEADYVEFCMYSNSLAVIREKIPGCNPSTLAFPGGEVYPEIAKRYFVAGRSTSPYISRANAINYQSVPGSSSGIDPGYVNVLLGGRGGSKALAGWKSAFNDPKNYRGWFVPFLHTEQTHDGLPNSGHETGVAEQVQRMALLGRHRRHLWLGTFPAVAKYGQSRDTATLTVGTKSASAITFTLTDRMRDDWYDEPLTVKIRLPSAWALSGVAATQGGKSLDAFVVEHEGAKYALVNAVPDRGEVTLAPSAENSGTWDETSYATPTYTYQVRFYDADGKTLLKNVIGHPAGTSAAGEAPVLHNPGHRLSWATADGVALDDITDDVDFTAVWTATDEKPQAVFKNANGETLTTVETVYGSRPAQPTDAALGTPSGYIACWDPQLEQLESNAVYTVRFVPDDDPVAGAIVVRTAEEFCDAMANHPDATIRMVCDVDISGYGYTAASCFSGTFKAYGHVLSGLGAGSFCVTNAGSVVGLRILGDSDAEHPVIVSDYGVFAKVSAAGVFTDCRVDGYAIRANAQNVQYGVFVATATEGTAFSNCTIGATCSINQGGKPNVEIGGFAGQLKVTDPSGTLITFFCCTNEAPLILTGDNNTAHGDGGFIGRASGCGAASSPEILFVNCADKGLVSSSGGNSNLGGYIGYIPSLTAKAPCTVTFEGGTTTTPVGTGSNVSIGDWIGKGANANVVHREYVPPEEPDDPPEEPDVPPEEPDDPPEEPVEPEVEFVTNGWFEVEFADTGYQSGAGWVTASSDRSGGVWSGDGDGATSLDDVTRRVTIPEDFPGELLYTPSDASPADADVILEGEMQVSAAARDLRPADVPLALTFESAGAAKLTPVVYVGDAWHSFGSTGFAADAWVGWKIEVDQASTNAPRLRVTVSEEGGGVETSGWIAGGFAARKVSSLSYVGAGSFGDFKGRYLTAKGGGETVELVEPQFSADGSALGFEPGAGGARVFALKIVNPVKGAYYTVLTAASLEGPFLPAAESTLFTEGETLTLRVDADTPQKFAKIMVSAQPLR